jgi:tetratricopeptide (TPR) repeat protein
MVKQAAGRTPPIALFPAYMVLADLAAGSPARAKARLDKVDDASLGAFARELIRGQIATTQADPAAEAAALIRASLAVDLGTPDLGREWAMSVLKARRTCQWAAKIVLQTGPDAAAQRELTALLQPPDCTMARAVRAGLLSQEGKHAEAAGLYGQIAKAENNNAFLLMSQAAEWEAAGRFDQALAVYREIWKAMSSPVAANNCADMLCQLGTEDVKGSPEVQAWLDAAGKAAGDNPAFRDTRGWILHLQDKTEAALKDLRYAANGRPDSPQVHYHLAVVEIASGNKEFARWHLMAAVAIGNRIKEIGRQIPASEAKAIEQATQLLAQMGPPSP